MNTSHTQTEQPATKPAHTPSAGAMRAARALAVSKPLIDAIHSGVGQYGIAQIIDRETAHAELVATIKNLLTARPEDWQQAATWAYAALARAQA